MKKSFKHGRLYLLIIIIFILPYCNQNDLYQNATSPISDITAPAPGNSGEITVDVLVTQATLRWEKATDNITPQDSLEYAICVSATPDIPDPEVARSKAIFFQTWKKDISTVDIIGLEEITIYFFNVFVRDKNNNLTKYNEASVTTKYNEPPVPGNSGSISIPPEHIAENSLILNWTEASDDLTSTEDLEYLVYKSTDPDIDNLYQAELNIHAEKVNTWTPGITTINIKDLCEAETYYFNVFVRDDIAPSEYQKKMVRTSDSTPPEPGNSGIIIPSNLMTTSATISWTAATDNGTEQNEIWYSVYCANNSEKVKNYNRAINSDATRIEEWIMDISSIDVAGLTQNTTYYFNVFVHDGNKNNITAYTPRRITTNVNGAPVPGNTGIITNPDPLTTSVELHWTKANDADTSQEFLQYYICGSIYPNISSTSEVFPTLPAGAWKIADWTTDIDMFQVSSLNEATKYYFNIFVQDNGFDISAYTMVSVTTTDGQPPQPGNNGIIQTTEITSNSVTLAWDYAVDQPAPPAGMPQENLQYIVYKSLLNDIATEKDVFTFGNGTPVTGWIKNINSMTIDELDPDTDYYFNVFVKDNSNPPEAYNITDPPVRTNVIINTIYMYSTPVHNGNLGGREGADLICTTIYDNLQTSIKFTCSNWHAFISISKLDSIEDMPSNYGVPDDGTPIMSFKGIPVENGGWSELLDSSSWLDYTLYEAGLITDSTPWWSGSDPEGKFDTNTANCTASGNDEAFTTNAGKGRTGRHDSKIVSWLNDNEPNCNAARHVLCVCW